MTGKIVEITEPTLPGTCVVCGRNANGIIKFIDFNLNLDYFGAVVFCEDCIRESLSVVRHLEIESLEAQLAATVLELEVAQVELDKYKSAFDSLGFIRPDLNPLSHDDDVKSEDIEDAVGQSEPTDGERLEAESDSDGSDSVGGLENFSIFKD